MRDEQRENQPSLLEKKIATDICHADEQSGW
jgi:hypothetical protein